MSTPYTESLKIMEKAWEAIEAAEYNIKGGFSELFIKPAIFPDFVASHIKTAFDLRQEADYDFDADIPTDVITEVVNNTKEFYRYAITYLKTLEAGKD